MGPQTGFDRGITLCRAEFLDSIREGRKPLTDGYAGLRVVRILEAAQQSIKNGGQVTLLVDNMQTAPA